MSSIIFFKVLQCWKKIYEHIPMSIRKFSNSERFSHESQANLPEKDKICALKNLKNTSWDRVFCKEHKGIKNARSIAAVSKLITITTGLCLAPCAVASHCKTSQFCGYNHFMGVQNMLNPVLWYLHLRSACCLFRSINEARNRGYTNLSGAYDQPVKTQGWPA